MKVVTDSDIKQLVIEALDYNAQLIAMCTLQFGNINSQSKAKRFRDDFINISKESEKRRKAILGISD